jgi:hypothetical protein
LEAEGIAGLDEGLGSFFELVLFAAEERKSARSTLLEFLCL